MIQRFFNLFVLLSALVSLFLLLPFFLIRRKKPSNLKFTHGNKQKQPWKKGNSLKEASSPFPSSHANASSHANVNAGSHANVSANASHTSHTHARAHVRLQEINVLFREGSKTYDAYELLHLPAGSSFAEAQEQYQKLSKERILSPEKKQLLKKALDCIYHQKKGDD